MQRSWGEGHAALRLQARPGLYTSCLSPDRLTAGSQAWVRARMPRGWIFFAKFGKVVLLVLVRVLIACCGCAYWRCSYVVHRFVSGESPSSCQNCRCSVIVLPAGLFAAEKWSSGQISHSAGGLCGFFLLGHPGELCTSTAAPAADASNR